MSRESEPCAQQLTGNCEGCPVLYKLLDEVRIRSVYRPGQVKYELEDAANEIAVEYCPQGVKPQTDLLSVGVSYGGFAGKVATVTLRNYNG